MRLLRKKNLFGFIWRSLNWLRRGVSVVIFLLMLAFTVASHTVPMLADLLTNAIRTVSGATTLLSDAVSTRNAALERARSSEARLANASDQLSRKNAQIADLNKQNAGLSKKNADLNKQNARLNKQNAGLNKQNALLNKPRKVMFRGKSVLPSEAVSTTVKGVQDRTKKVAVTNIGSAVGESIPIYGIGIIAAVTSYEIYSACETMKDLHELQKSINPSVATDDARDFVCGLPKPTRAELWNTIKTSPQAAWEGAVSGLETTYDWAGNLEPPDFSGAWVFLLERVW